MNNLPIAFRDAQETDLNFILHSWTNSLFDQFPYRHVRPSTFKANQTPIIQALLSTSSVKVVTAADDPDLIYGYIVYERIADEMVIHWLLVKFKFYGFGLAKELLLKAFPEFGTKPCVITSCPPKNKTNSAEFTKDTLIKYKMIFDPYIINRRIAK